MVSSCIVPHFGKTDLLNEFLPWLGAPREEWDASKWNFFHMLHWLHLLPYDFRTILDVGCGYGHQTVYFHSIGKVVTACDPWDRFDFKDKIPYFPCPVEEFPKECLRGCCYYVSCIRTYMESRHVSPGNHKSY